MVFGLDVLRLGPGSIGVFTAAQVVGSIVSAPLMALLSEKRGRTSVIRLVAVMALLLPLAGIALVILAPVGSQAVLTVILGAIFFLLGGVNNGNMAGFTNYLLDHAPAAQRAVYVGLANTLNGLVLVAPVLGGWLLTAFSWPVLFAVTAAVSLVGLLGTFRVHEPVRPPGE
jgi:MFS family permease